MTYTTLHNYHLYADVIDQDDDGDDQVSIYRCSFAFEKYLTPTDALKYAETHGDWEVHLFGEGEESKVGTALLEYSAPKNLSNKDWWTIRPISICI